MLKCRIIILILPLLLCGNIFSQTVNFESNCITDDFIPFTGVDATGRNTYSDGSVEIRYLGTFGWWVVYINSNLAFRNVSSSTPDPPTDALWIDMGYMTCTSMDPLVINAAPPPAEICNNGIDDDLDYYVDCVDTDCNGDVSCPDFDNDGISNVLDKDDDNDGFSDIQESSDFLSWDYFGWTHTIPTGNINLDNTSNTGLVSWFGQNFSMEQSNNVTQVIVGSSSQVSDIASNTFEESLVNGEYMFYQFDTQANLIDPVINEVECGVDDNANGDSFHVALLISDDSFASYAVLSKDVLIDGNPASYTQHNLDQFGYYHLNEGETYELRAYLYGMLDTGPGDFAIWDDFFVTVSAGSAFDFDGDGYDNHQDLDSDNDGLFDILEGNGFDPDNDGSVGNGPINDPNANGWSSIYDQWDGAGGSVLVDIISEGIGLPDRINLDSDGDGCKDVIEAGFPDSNSDGILGGIPVTNNSTGTVIFTP